MQSSVRHSRKIANSSRYNKILATNMSTKRKEQKLSSMKNPRKTTICKIMQ
jgi:hypothetical protein